MCGVHNANFTLVYWCEQMRCAPHMIIIRRGQRQFHAGFLVRTNEVRTLQVRMGDKKKPWLDPYFKPLRLSRMPSAMRNLQACASLISCGIIGARDGWCAPYRSTIITLIICKVRSGFLRTILGSCVAWSTTISRRVIGAHK
jgi:hypothetical protein